MKSQTFLRFQLNGINTQGENIGKYLSWWTFHYVRKEFIIRSIYS